MSTLSPQDTGLKKVTLDNGTELIVMHPLVLKEYIRLYLQDGGQISQVIADPGGYFDILIALVAQELKKKKPIVFSLDEELVSGYPVTLTHLAKNIYDNWDNMSEETKISLGQPVTLEDL